MLGLVEFVMKLHSENNPGPTHNRNTNKQVIDRIFATPSLRVTRAGHLAFGETGFSDHKLIWVDFEANQVYGHKTLLLHKRNINKLKMEDPRMVDRYNAQVAMELEK